MKKYLAMICILASLISFSQLEKGTKITGGTFTVSKHSEHYEFIQGHTSTNYKVSDVFIFKALPSLGILLNNNIAIGASFGYSFSKEIDYESISSYQGIYYDNTMKESIFSISPFVKFYKQVGPKVFLFTQVALSYDKGTFKQLELNSTGSGTEDSEPYKINAFSPKVILGVNYFLNEKLALELNWAAASYKYQTVKQTSSSNTSTGENEYKYTISDFGLNFDFDAIFIGLIYVY